MVNMPEKFQILYQNLKDESLDAVFGSRMMSYKVFLKGVCHFINF